MAICAGSPTRAVAVNMTGLPWSLGAVAWRVFGPTVRPSVQFTPAAPVASLNVVSAPTPSTDPPPLLTVNVTATPATPLPFASTTRTTGTVATWVPTSADCPSPAPRTSCAAAPAPPTAENVTGLPVSPDRVAVSVLAPAVVPSVQPPTAARPSPPVFIVAGPVILPPPVATAKVTATPVIGLPY